MKSVTKLWGPILWLELLAGFLGFLAYRWIVLHPTLRPLWTWLLARATGIGAYSLLTIVVIMGIGMSHPVWKRHLNRRFFVWHRGLALSVLALIALHGLSLALDRYAHVGWTGLLVPGFSHYRPYGVAFGVIAAEGLVLVSLSAYLAQNFGRLKWMTVHRGALLMWVLVLIHGLWSGSDTRALALFYEASAGLVGMAVILRYGMERVTRAKTVVEYPGDRQIHEKKKDI
ncbi:hypothetical protein [Sulfobacillus thermosulfidooxidans]|uniref:hypothetical protein n=1 Tax=Sulfobacillus thermosulfidooxidans TaxID=28034 RepID=UPI00096B997C|nr:hypothetical protein [Sulfobacillus thermosulfidooxidans]OLZ10371.1 hypothetical protein BFX05_10295 [Sulfobacillus thermosulfidooxidans]OLZ15261.1 hypothetical protein BFX06_04820 [Sulfobacillus thermosulfidooxidans]OLZ21118.1 hypothetical protein BFX07_13985 [Sulfobacillus thermosulfidooxidans]